MARPAKCGDAKSLQKKIDSYFDKCDADKVQPTISGLTYHMGYEDRQSFYDLKHNPKFSCVIKKSLTKLASRWEALLGRGCNNGGAMFWLKNHGWSDHLDITSGGDKLQPAQIVVSSEVVKSSLEEAIADVNHTDDKGI